MAENSRSGRLPGILLLVFVWLYGGVAAQDLSQRITLKIKDRPVSEVLEEITALSGIRFSYNPSELPLRVHVSVRARNKPVGEILAALLLEKGIRYTRVEDYLVLKPSPVMGDGVKRPAGGMKARVTVSGYLKSRDDGEALIGASVYIRGTSTGVQTNGYGFYSLSLTPGNYQVTFSYLGFREVTEELAITEDTRLSVALESEKLEMKEVEIVAPLHSGDQGPVQLGEFRFSSATLGQMPGFGGNVDVIRALQAVPGVQTFGDGSALYYVRGGNSDQNLLLIDEVPVYNPSHLFGFFTAFSPDAINSVQVYKGDFPARYGGRLSSVIDIRAKEGNMNRFGFSGNIGPYASSLTVEGPLAAGKSSFLVSGRVSTLNWLNQLSVFNRDFDFNFFDINGKFNVRLGENDRIYFTFYTGRDVFSRYVSPEVNSLGISWNNLAATFRWNHLFTSKLFANTTLNYSLYNYALNLPRDDDGYWNSVISNLTLKSDASWYAAPRLTFRSGIELTYHYSNPGNLTLEDGSEPGDVPSVPKYHSMEYVFYASCDQRIGSRFSVRYGLRLPVWQDLGPTDVFYFNPLYEVIDTVSFARGEAYSTAFSPEPRISIQYRAGENISLKAGYTRTTQFLQVLSNSTGPFTSLEVWAPCGPNIEPQIADQVTGGYFMELPGPALRLSAEGYYKWFSNRIDYRDHANLLFNPLIEGELRQGKGWSYGVELMVRKMTGKLTGWIGYTWSRSFVQTPGIDNGAVYPAGYDRPHDLGINLS